MVACTASSLSSLVSLDCSRRSASHMNSDAHGGLDRQHAQSTLAPTSAPERQDALNTRRLFVEPGDLERVPCLYRRHFVGNDAGIVCEELRESLHDFRRCWFARLVAKNFETPVLPAAWQQDPA